VGVSYDNLLRTQWTACRGVTISVFQEDKELYACFNGYILSEHQLELKISDFPLNFSSKMSSLWSR
jgi:hypothetical protein